MLNIFSYVEQNKMMKFQRLNVKFYTKLIPFLLTNASFKIQGVSVDMKNQKCFYYFQKGGIYKIDYEEILNSRNLNWER